MFPRTILLSAVWTPDDENEHTAESPNAGSNLNALSGPGISDNILGALSSKADSISLAGQDESASASSQSVAPGDPSATGRADLWGVAEVTFLGNMMGRSDGHDKYFELMKLTARKSLRTVSQPEKVSVNVRIIACFLLRYRLIQTQGQGT